MSKRCHKRPRHGATRCFGPALLVLALLWLLPAGNAWAAPSQRYFQVDRLMLPVIRRGGLEGHLLLVVFLEVTDTKHRAVIRQKMPRLRDEYIRSLNRYIAHRPRILYRVRLREVKVLLFQATERIIGTGKVKAVLVQAVASRRF